MDTLQKFDAYGMPLAKRYSEKQSTYARFLRRLEMNDEMGLAIEDLRFAHLTPILTLNNLNAEQTSFLDESSLERLLGIACYARGTDGGATSILIALDQDAAYDNPNFSWFKARHERFIYVDRIIVSSALRGQGVARALYRDLFAWATLTGQTQVVCEVNLRPPNPGSDAFHKGMGFVEVGQAEIHGGAKCVRYLQKFLL